MGTTAKLVYNGKEYDLPIVTGSENEIAIDISKLRAQTGLITIDDGFPKDSHPMATLGSMICTLSGYYVNNETDPLDAQEREMSIHRLLAKVPTIAAFSHKKSVGQPFMYPKNSLSYVANFIQMMF